MAQELACPDCGEPGFQSQGLHGHLRFKHNHATERARGLVEQAKDQAGQSGQVGQSTVAEGAESDPRSDEFGEVSEHVRKRLSETADTAAAMRMLEVLEEDNESGEDPFRAAAAQVMAEAAREGLSGGDEGLTAEDVRAVVRQETERPDRQPATDGFGDWRTAAIQGDLDREQIEALAEIERAGRLGNSVEKIAERFFEEDGAETLNSALDLAKMFLARGDRREVRRFADELARTRDELAMARRVREEEREEPDPADYAGGESGVE